MCCEKIESTFKNYKMQNFEAKCSCWRCDGSSSWEHCWSEGAWEDCQGDQGTCQVTVRRRGTDFWINTSCKQVIQNFQTI